jgi:hypothetical protein
LGVEKGGGAVYRGDLVDSPLVTFFPLALGRVLFVALVCFLVNIVGLTFRMGFWDMCACMAFILVKGIAGVQSTVDYMIVFRSSLLLGIGRDIQKVASNCSSLLGLDLDLRLDRFKLAPGGLGWVVQYIV